MKSNSKTGVDGYPQSTDATCDGCVNTDMIKLGSQEELEGMSTS